MARVNSRGYLERITYGNSKVCTNWRDWWLVKPFSSSLRGKINLREIYLPPQYIGKRIRFKIEVLDDKKIKC